MRMVAYCSPDWGLPGKRYFRCEPMAATITTDACEANWRASNESDCERLLKCRACPIGAVHAGETAASLSPLRGAKVCARCLTGTTRLIGSWLCVSCYNREREWVAQRNAKGRIPTRMAPLSRRVLKVVDADGSRMLARDLSVGLEELMVAALRDSAKATVFSFNGATSAQFPQGALW